MHIHTLVKRTVREGHVTEKSHLRKALKRKPRAKRKVWKASKYSSSEAGADLANPRKSQEAPG